MAAQGRIGPACRHHKLTAARGRLGGACAWALALLVAGGATVWAPEAAAQQDGDAFRRVLYAVRGDAELRSGPGDEHDRVASIPRDTRLVAVGRRERKSIIGSTIVWYEVQTEAGRTGFVDGRSLLSLYGYLKYKTLVQKKDALEDRYRQVRDVTGSLVPRAGVYMVNAKRCTIDDKRIENLDDWEVTDLKLAWSEGSTLMVVGLDDPANTARIRLERMSAMETKESGKVELYKRPDTGEIYGFSRDQIMYKVDLKQSRLTYSAYSLCGRERALIDRALAYYEKKANDSRYLESLEE